MSAFGSCSIYRAKGFILISPRTASRELQELCKKGLIEKKAKGPAVYYILAKYGEIWRGKKGKEKIG